MNKNEKPYIHQGESVEDKIINSYYCGQIYALHMLIWYLYRAKKKYTPKQIFRFIESRYCYLIREYPNFYNRIKRNDIELGAEAEKSYKVMFEAMMKHFKDISENDPKI